MQARLARRRNAQDTVYASLPETARDANSTWDTMSMTRFSKIVTPADAISRLHAARTDCKSSTCPFHNESVDA